MLSRVRSTSQSATRRAFFARKAKSTPAPAEASSPADSPPKPKRTRKAKSLEEKHNTVITVDTITSKIVTKTPGLLEKLKKELSAPDEESTVGMMIAMKRMGRFWRAQPKLRSLIDRHGNFGTGLLQRVIGQLQEANEPFVQAPARPVALPAHPTVTADFFKDSPKPLTLHDYQLTIINRCLEERRGIVKLATGGGKTVIFAAILKALKDEPAMVLMRPKSLTDQTYKVLQDLGIPDVGRVHGDVHEPNRVTCATITSLGRLEEEVKKTRVLIVDEVHSFGTGQSIQDLSQFTNAVYRLGFSATPFKDDESYRSWRIVSQFGPMLSDLTVEDLKEKQVLAQSHVHFYRVRMKRKETTPLSQSGDPSEDEVVKIERDTDFFNKYRIAVEDYMINNQEYHQAVAAIVNKIPSGRILILVERLSHGDSIHKLLPGSFWVTGEDSTGTREHVFEQLRTSKKAKVVAICSNIGFYGLNVYVHHVINAAGGKDPSMVIQKIGRGLRKAEDKEKLEYHDFILDHPTLKRHSLERMKTLEKEGHTLTTHYQL